jgi:hypothetical protein
MSAMQAVKLKTYITKNHRLELDLPDDIPEGDAEVIVLVQDAPEPAGEESLRDFFQALDASPRPRMSKEEIDRYIEEARNSWD